jgi:hypothetical protein
VSRQQVRSADLLAQAFAVSANLALRRERSLIVQYYDRIQAEAQRRRAAVARYLENAESLRLWGLDDLVRAVSGESLPGALIALPQIGPFALAAALIARSGVKIATVFWDLGGEVKELLENSQVVLLRLDRNLAPRSTIREIEELQSSGFGVCLLIEVPMRSRRRYGFLGYRVACSSLIEACARHGNRRVHRLCAMLDDMGDVRLAVESALRGRHLTQRLLCWAEKVAIAHIDQYNWSEASIVFSDPAAYENGLSFLPEILSWRDRELQKQHGSDRRRAVG